MHTLNPLNHPICFSYPLRVATTAWTQHIPFGMFLIDLLRPDTFVELGTFTGVSYCAFCQAVKELRLDARCYAVDHWEGDEHAGFYGEELFADLSKHHDPLYGTFSTLIRSTFDEARTHFENGSIDLLHIDGYHTYEAVKKDFTDWLPRMSSKGVILFHDTQVRERDFGVWRLWEELKLQYGHFEMVHGHGLGLLAVGEQQAEPIRALLNLSEENLLAVRGFFYQLGSRLEKEQGAQALSVEVKERQAAIDGLTRRLSEKEHLVQGLSMEMNERGRAVSNLMTELTEKERAIAELTAQLEEKKSAVEVLETDAARNLQAVAQLDARLEAADRTTQTLAAEAEEKERILTRITSSRGWRILSWYGRIKYRYLLPVYRLFGKLPEHDAGNSLKTGLDSRVPDTVVVGKGNALFLCGWCFHPKHRIKRLRLLINGRSHPVKAFRMGRPDVLQIYFPRFDPSGQSYRSGFWSIVPLPKVDNATEAELQVQATLSTGEVCLEPLASLRLSPTIEQLAFPVTQPGRDSKEPLIAICMTSFNPPLELFAGQVESIRNQTHSSWICIISDDGSKPDVFAAMQEIIGGDERFHLYPSKSRLGFYHNFERVLSLAPEAAQFIALSDHDDYWHPNKLQVLLSQFRAGTTLVYSDMNIVDDRRRQIAGTYWTRRPNNYENFASLLMANTITGAASMFPRSLLSTVLPFPEKIGDAYHDHWIGCVALATGEVRFVDQSLYDYVQHSSNVLGHFAPPRDKFFRKLVRFVLNISRARETVRTNLGRWRAIYFYDLMKIQLISRVLELRCDSELTDTKRRILRRIGRVDESFLALAWLLIRGLRNIGRVSETLGAESALLRAIIWKKSWTLKSWIKSGAFSKAGKPLPSARTAGPAASEARPAAVAGPSPGFDEIAVIQQKTAPLLLQVSEGAPRRINLLIPTVDLKYFFGGYITKFNLACRLADERFRVRIIIVDHCDYVPTIWKQQLKTYQGLEKLFDRVELAYAFDRTAPLEVSRDDVFIATTWWTAHIAHRATQVLGKERFLYLIQEYEPFTFPMGTFAAVANQTYDFPHYAIFSTEFLRDYFRQNRLGVFALSVPAGDQDSISFQNTITDVGRISVEDIANRSPRRLLFYSRPEAHASRNMFEMAVMGLSQAIESGYFKGEWEFYGIGTVQTSARIRLANGVSMQLLPRQNQDTYRQVLRAHDLGLSLMYTPHPSLVPIEMASAGMLVVTNTYANKTVDKLRAISENIIAVAPTIEEVTRGLKEAAANIGDYDLRVRGSRVAWSTDWDSAFNRDVMAQIQLFIDADRVVKYASRDQ